MTEVKLTAELAKFLDAYGPWAMVAVTIVAAGTVVYWLGKRAGAEVSTMKEQLQRKDEQLAKKDEQLLELVERRHEEFTAVIEKTVDALSTATDVQQQVIVCMDRCDREHRERNR